MLNTPDYFDPNEVQDFAEYLEQHASTYLTLIQDQKVVGGIGYFVNKADQSGSITWIFFHPDYQGKGLGKQAVEYCHSILRKDNRVKKFVITTSQVAYQFFETFGYQTIRTEKDYWGDGLDLYEMEMWEFT